MRQVHAWITSEPHIVVLFDTDADGPCPFANVNTQKQLLQLEREIIVKKPGSINS
jgi:molybdopterin-guanine dinucleotide biosynthesis protein A